MFKVKNSTRVALVFDGLWAHNHKGVRFTLRHGKRRSNATERLCNVLFLDVHVASLRGSDLPRTTDVMTDGSVLNTAGNGKWAITLISKRVP